MIQFLKFRKEKRIIYKSQQFDFKYYLFTYPEVRIKDMEAIRHYVKYGAKAGKNPNPNFDTLFYTDYYNDILPSNMNPFIHYITIGKATGCCQNKFELEIQLLGESQYFDKNYYLEKYPDIKDAGIDPVEHYLLYGFKEGRNPSENFNTKFYIEKYSIEEGLNPVIHFINYGQKLGFITFSEVSKKLQIIPYYFDETKIEEKCILDGKVAIHIYINDINSFKNLIKRFENIEIFDLFISAESNIALADIDKIVNTNKLNINQVYIKAITKTMDNLEALIVLHGENLALYKYIGNFYTFDDSLTDISPLLDIYNAFRLLNDDANIIYAGDKQVDSILDPSGWEGNFNKAKILLANNLELDISNYKTLDIPETSMFWAEGKCLNNFLSLSDEAPLVSEFLKQVLVISANNRRGKNYSIYTSDTLTDYMYYEEQKDYSETNKHTNIKVLSYYLGQFHPIPENDEWHGKGFTEWTNVKRAYPLFEGHYHQHIPHKDLGYYMLDNPDILKKQASMMKKSGVYGQIFYHYWFTGKLILEKPAQMLLKNKDIDMPFCFCWANENWTRRWDGEDDDVLLGQTYSADDAREFIKYLIPFFHDSRYIRIKNRPVLYVYRSTAIPDPEEYIKIWAEECEKASLSAPYLVTVLTRGATTPNDFGMDAGVERILFDWTDGAVPNLIDTLDTYYDLTGSVIDYSQVADFYENQTDKKDFTYFRSISPIWDNTARYQEGAYALHKSTPNRFQNWFKNLIDYSENALNEDEQFIVVNAWNEWAEGAHLEPDVYHGFSYLNSIGRALSNMNYDEKIIESSTSKLRVHLTISASTKKMLETDAILKKQFIHCVSRSSIFNSDLSFSSKDAVLINSHPSINEEEASDDDLIIHFQNISLFDSTSIENMIHTHLDYGYATIISNTYGDETVYDITENNSINREALFKAAIHVKSKKDSKNVKICLSARCFLAFSSQKDLTDVTTVIRFHKSGNIQELENALLCLCAMQDIRVKILIAAQDLDTSIKESLNDLINILPLKHPNDVEVTYYNSLNGKGDLRTKMINESLLSVKTRYITFLDYDDVLFSHAYSYMLGRLKETGKAISFARVFYTSYDSKRELITKREKSFEYGYTYTEFVNHNHAPIHSFMLDLKYLDLKSLVYHDDQLYMEDYYLTLQLFTEDNSDWESLHDNIYIGDYIHCTDREQTLAIHCDNERNALLNDIKYKKDEERICDLRNKLLDINTITSDI